MFVYSLHLDWTVSKDGSWQLAIDTVAIARVCRRSALSAQLLYRLSVATPQTNRVGGSTTPTASDRRASDQSRVVLSEDTRAPGAADEALHVAAFACLHIAHRERFTVTTSRLWYACLPADDSFCA